MQLLYNVESVMRNTWMHQSTFQPHHKKDLTENEDIYQPV